MGDITEIWKDVPQARDEVAAGSEILVQMIKKFNCKALLGWEETLPPFMAIIHNVLFCLLRLKNFETFYPWKFFFSVSFYATRYSLNLAFEWSI